MSVVRPVPGSSLGEQVLKLCGSAPALLVCLAPASRPLADLEPFALLRDVLGDELLIAEVHGWPEEGWRGACAGLADTLGMTLDQARRAETQSADEPRLEVLFLESGAVRGSALTVVDRRRLDGHPLTLNAKLAALQLLQAARDAGLTGLRDLCVRARDALGVPAGPVTRIAPRAPAASPPAAAQPGALRPPTAAPVPPARGTPSARPVAATPAAAGAPVPPPRSTPEERHAVTGGTCSRCGKSGPRLEEACGKPELGRIGVIELD